MLKQNNKTKNTKKHTDYELTKIVLWYFFVLFIKIFEKIYLLMYIRKYYFTLIIYTL